MHQHYKRGQTKTFFFLICCFLGCSCLWSVCMCAGYTVSSVVIGNWRTLYVAGAPRFKHKGKVILFDFTNDKGVDIVQAMNGEQVKTLNYCWGLKQQSCLTFCSNGSIWWTHHAMTCICLQIGSYFGSEVCGLDIDQDGITDVLLIAAPMFLSSGNKEAGKVYIYSLSGVRATITVTQFLFDLGNHNSSVFHRRGFLYQTVPWSQIKSPRMPGLAMHWQLLLIWIMMISLTWWSEHLWRMST